MPLFALQALCRWKEGKVLVRRATKCRRMVVVMADVDRDGLDALDRRSVGDLVHFRRHELAAALNRLRTLRVDG